MGNTCCCQKHYDDPNLLKRNTKKLSKKQRKELQKAHKNGDGPDAETLCNLYH